MSQANHDSWIQRRYQQLQSENDVSAQTVRYFLIFLAGVLIGWFVIGWWLWPVRYTAVYPNELRSDARSEYFRMVAESYAATQDIGLAAQRLKYWTPEELGPLLSAEIEATRPVNPAVADRMQQIFILLRLSAEGPAPGQPAAPRSLSDQLRLLLARPIARVGLAVLILGVIAWLIIRAMERRAPVAPETPVSLEDMADEETPPDFEDIIAPPAPTMPDEPPWDEGEYEEDMPFDEEEEPLPEEEETAVSEPESVLPPPLTPPPLSDEETDEEENDEEEPFSETFPTRGPEQTPSPAKPSAPTPPLQMGDDAERFIFEGDPYYNQIFAIEKEGEYLGEFGMGVGETLADQPNHILTMEVWLFEKRDIRTVTAALIPPQIYRDSELRQELLDGDIIPVALEPGATIHLETEGLEVVGQVRRVEFSPSIEDRPTIRYLELDMVGREKDGESSISAPPW